MLSKSVHVHTFRMETSAQVDFGEVLELFFIQPFFDDERVAN